MARGIRLLAIVLLPTLALAAPKVHHKPKPKPVDPPADTGSGSAAGSDTKPADTNAADSTPATAPAPTGGGGGPGSGAGSAMGSGAGSGSATTTAEPPPANEPDVDSLRQEYLSLRDELFKSRARANAVASQLYSTRISIRFTWASARYYGVSKASIRLDGASVYEDTTGAIAGDDGVRFDGYVAPGRHLVTFHVEATGKDDDSFTSITESQIVVKAVANKDLIVAAKGKDSGDIAYEWKRKERGNYGLGIDVSVKSIASVAEGAAKGAKK